VRSPRLRLAALAAAPLLLLSACSTEGGDGDTADQTATTDDAAATSVAPNGDISELSVDTSGDEPVIERDGEPFADSDLPFVVGSTEVETVEKGDGKKVAPDHEVKVRYVAVNGATGEPFASTYDADETVTIDLNNEMLFPAFLEELPGRSAGETLLMTIPAEDGFGSGGNQQLGVGPQDTLVFYMEIVDSAAPLTKATGEAVKPKAGLPEVKADGESPAQITIPADAKEPTELVVQPLIKGEGPEVQAGQTIKVHYTGVKWSDGEVFDESYQRGEPTEFQIGVGQVIQGWDEGLVGQTVGSRVLLVIPADQAYGEKPEDTAGATAPPAHELAGETLVFVVDILGAS
jgi:peptidylprolyl isomerase